MFSIRGKKKGDTYVWLTCNAFYFLMNGVPLRGPLLNLGDEAPFLPSLSASYAQHLS